MSDGQMLSADTRNARASAATCAKPALFQMMRALRTRRGDRIVIADYITLSVLSCDTLQFDNRAQRAISSQVIALNAESLSSPVCDWQQNNIIHKTTTKVSHTKINISSAPMWCRNGRAGSWTSIA
jgi:hypothetical protein